MRTYTLWHPDSPGVRLIVRRPGLLRRLGINRSCFATLSEALNYDTSYVNWFSDDPRTAETTDLTR